MDTAGRLGAELESHASNPVVGSLLYLMWLSLCCCALLPTKERAQGLLLLSAV